MPRKSIALFLATTSLISTLAGCSTGKEAGEQGGDTLKTTPSGQSQPRHNNKPDEGDGKDNKGAEGGEGGEG